MFCSVICFIMLLLYSSVFRFDQNTNSTYPSAECIYFKTLFIEFHQLAGPTEASCSKKFLKQMIVFVLRAGHLFQMPAAKVPSLPYPLEYGLQALKLTLSEVPYSICLYWWKLIMHAGGNHSRHCFRCSLHACGTCLTIS